MADQKTISVSSYLDQLNDGLSRQGASIVGELCEVKHYDGYSFFTLKDSDDESILKCIIFKYQRDISGVELADGLDVVLSGTPNVYKPNGNLTYKVQTVEVRGQGELQKKYEELKKRLDQEGVFAASRKKELPKYPKRIGLLTSKNSDAFNDFRNNLGSYGYDVRFLPTRVEGKEALPELMEGLDTFRGQGIDLLIIVRGGGSLDSFAAFNTEALVRKLVDYPVPVLCGIGHDKDVPLLALAADKQVSSPTGAALELKHPWKEAANFVEATERRLVGSVSRAIAERATVLKNTRDRFRSAAGSIAIDARKLIEQFKTRLNSHDPKRQLKLGYSLVRVDGRLLRSAADASQGATLETELVDGRIMSEVIGKEQKQ